MKFRRLAILFADMVSNDFNCDHYRIVDRHDIKILHLGADFYFYQGQAIQFLVELLFVFFVFQEIQLSLVSGAVKQAFD